MGTVKALETAMLLCFGAAWPASIWKSWTSRTAKGKSLLFMCIVLLGYACGVTKVLLTDGPRGFLMIPYTLDCLLVLTDLCLYIRNRGIDRRRAPSERMA